MCHTTCLNSFKMIHPVNLRLECTDSKCSQVYIFDYVMFSLYIAAMLWGIGYYKSKVDLRESLVHAHVKSHIIKAKTEQKEKDSGR